MRAFDFVITLYSFVYALAVAQILSTVGDMIRAGKRLCFSWINAGWMLNVLLAIVAWWLSPVGPQDRATLGHGYRPRLLCRRLLALRVSADGQRTNPRGGPRRPTALRSRRRAQICGAVRGGVRDHHRNRLPLRFDKPELDCFELGDGADTRGEHRRGGHGQSVGPDGGDPRDHTFMDRLFRHPPRCAGVVAAGKLRVYA